MPYLFNDGVFLEIQTAFSSAAVEFDPLEYSDIDKRDYFFIRFPSETLLGIPFDEARTINLILNGDKKITDLCNHALCGTAKVALGFRWSGDVSEIKKLIFLGFCIKIIYFDDKKKLRDSVIKAIGQILSVHRLIGPRHHFENYVVARAVRKMPCHQLFFKMPMTPSLLPTLLSAAREFIKATIHPVFPAYIRENEIAINPAYQDISSTKAKLFLNEKKIWLFRTDLILAVGNKNAYWINFAESGLADAIHAELHRYINWEDRYGHPSLAIAYPGYPSSAFYGGLLAQRNGYLEVFTSSGRYNRNDLTEEEKQIMEAYIAHLFQQAYGYQPVIFVDSLSSQDYFECALFYEDKPLPEYCVKRRYDFQQIEHVLENLQSKYPKLCSAV